jgi:hypothetical protein
LNTNIVITIDRIANLSSGMWEAETTINVSDLHTLTAHTTSTITQCTQTPAGGTTIYTDSNGENIPGSAFSTDLTTLVEEWVASQILQTYANQDANHTTGEESMRASISADWLNPIGFR